MTLNIRAVMLFYNRTSLMWLDFIQAGFFYGQYC